ncbi:hypothetical protein [Cryobacterium sp. GrIS_2_6]|uniref:hypothetical protein n=1 Tax=Cryobacterium sp. GrIS_2_6 TaxID=3162785 RepID=UPI002E045246|nr:hypothetical protein [Cryobacterium psychrotolerans]
MDLTWLLVAVLLLVLFASISVIGALLRIATATEKTAADMKALLGAVRKTDIRP